MNYTGSYANMHYKDILKHVLFNEEIPEIEDYIIQDRTEIHMYIEAIKEQFCDITEEIFKQFQTLLDDCAGRKGIYIKISQSEPTHYREFYYELIRTNTLADLRLCCTKRLLETLDDDKKFIKFHWLIGNLSMPNVFPKSRYYGCY